MASQKFTCALLVATIMVVVVGQVNCHLPLGFERCDNTTAVVDTFDTIACPYGASTDSPCPLKHGQYVFFELFFYSAKDYSDAYTHLEMKDYSYKNDACRPSSRYGLKCPAKAGVMSSMVAEYNVDTSIAPRALDTMKFYLTDAKSQEVLVCVKFPVKITA